MFEVANIYKSSIPCANTAVGRPFACKSWSSTSYAFQLFYSELTKFINREFIALLFCKVNKVFRRLRCFQLVLKAGVALDLLQECLELFFGHAG